MSRADRARDPVARANTRAPCDGTCIRLRGLHLDLRGSIAFWNHGFVRDATTVVDAAFDAAVAGG